MKKLIAFFVIIVLLVSIKFFKTNDLFIFQDYSSMVIVTDKLYDNLNLQIQNGEHFYYNFNNNKEDHLKIKSINSDDIVSYVFYFNNNKRIEDFANIFDYIYQGESVEDYLIYYGYYANYNNFRYVSGKKVNFQLVKTAYSWILGFPLIVTGY